MWSGKRHDFASCSVIPRKHTFRTPYVHVHTGDSFVFKSASGKGPEVAVTFFPRTANRRA